MSAYCTSADLVSNGLKQVVINELPDVQAVITRASARIDSYLRGRYSLPLAVTPDEIKDACVQISCWFALQALGWDPQEGADKSVEHGYHESIKWLGLLSNGKVSLDVITDATPSVNEGAPVVRSIPRVDGIRRDGRI